MLSFYSKHKVCRVSYIFLLQKFAWFYLQKFGSFSVYLFKILLFCGFSFLQIFSKFNFLLDFELPRGDIGRMKRILFVLLLSIGLLSFMGACTTVEPERQKPTRDRGTKAQTSFGRPADWEGGLPGMPTNNMPRQY